MFLGQTQKDCIFDQKTIRIYTITSSKNIRPKIRSFLQFWDIFLNHQTEEGDHHEIRLCASFKK